MQKHDFEGFRCLCGDWVAVLHQECEAMADPATLRRIEGGDER